MPRAVPAVIFVTVVILGLALMAWQLAFVLLLAFAGVLLAVLLRHLALIVARHTPLSAGAGVGVAALGILGLIALGIVFAGPEMVNQFTQLIRSVPAALDQVEAMLTDQPWGRFLLEAMPADDAQPNWNIFGAVTGTVSTLVGVIANVVIVITVGVFLAADPGLYRRGVLHLIPMDARARAVEILDALGQGLWRWLIGQGIAMLAVAVLSGVGLWLIGVPLAMTLGIIAGLLDFVPYVGPWLGGAPAVLMALTLGPTEAIYTVILFVIIQQIEGNVLMPVIQKRASSLPPVLTVLAVVGFGVLFGFMGVLLATPLLLVLIVLVRMIYVEDILEDHTGDIVEQHEKASSERRKQRKSA
ncbi:AI-2E family transporter [Paracoccus sp. Z118]|uniref:AI-2E family transporter n=1 Tax=Paracoccus sp. Z118 TaxID=2851017 RepID=UPI001C2CC538|nr:AI-2E family transporter [Paracoccus sp. Z118]MBV0891836.1 AI-2E family transporter [Paracoccus sp. Z118]